MFYLCGECIMAKMRPNKKIIFNRLQYNIRYMLECNELYDKIRGRQGGLGMLRGLATESHMHL